MTDRRDGLSETLDEIAGRGKRDRTWEKEQRAAPDVCQVSYRGMPRRVKDKIKSIAKVEQVTADQVARRLLEYALEQYDAGTVTIETKPKIAKYEVV